MPSSLRHRSPVVTVLLILNSVFALATYPLLSMATGAGKVYVMSTYRELVGPAVQSADPSIAKTDGYWTIPDTINAGAFQYVKMATFVVMAAFVLNVLILGVDHFLLPSHAQTMTHESNENP
ncbi:MAG: hypothetical protein R3C10_07725 [Pirellulales bacterium]